MIATTVRSWVTVRLRPIAQDTDVIGGLAGQAGAVGLILDPVIRQILTLDRLTVELMLALRHPVLTKFMTSVTGLGSAAAAVVLLGLCHLAGWRRELTVSAASLSVAGIVVVSLMALVQRPFPPDPVCVTSGAEMTPHSFPSGHAAAVTIYAMVARESEHLPAVIVTAIAGAIAVSRIYLGTHFLSDTIAGVLIGIGAFVIGKALVDRLDDRGRLDIGDAR
ncbi:MAG: phosphatase PAP2 family protein [Halobacteriales archaeon]|nr:phosphatase PAP2 family protein [Halobacteriales archaeon]